MTDFEIRGSDDVDALVRRLNAHADAKAIKREMFSGLNRVTKPIREDMKDAAAKAAPSGYSSAVASDFSARTSAKGGRFAGVTIWAKGKRRNLVGMNRDGRLRHQLFGNRRFWFSQSVERGFFDKAFEENQGEATRAAVGVMEDIARKVC